MLFVLQLLPSLMIACVTACTFACTCVLIVHVVGHASQLVLHTPDSTCCIMHWEKECGDDRYQLRERMRKRRVPVRPPVRHSMLRRVSYLYNGCPDARLSVALCCVAFRPPQHFLIRGPSVRDTMLCRVSFQHLLMRDVAGEPPHATSRHHTSPYVTPDPLKPSHFRSRRRARRNVMLMYVRIAVDMSVHVCFLLQAKHTSYRFMHSNTCWQLQMLFQTLWTPCTNIKKPIKTFTLLRDTHGVTSP